MNKAGLVFGLIILMGILYQRVFPPNLPESGRFPTRFDLRQKKAIPGVREQSWGTCWAFATTLAMETNLQMTGEWSQVEEGLPHLSPYYLDKYSGFTRKGDDQHVTKTWESGQGSRFQGSNSDNLESGLIVHLGGDYRTAAATLTNSLGVPQQRLTPTIPRGGDHQAFGDLPTEGILKENNYTYFFPKEILWLSLEGSDYQKRVRVKDAIMKYGAVGSSQVMEDDPLAFASDGMAIFGTFNKEKKLDHAINLIGWDDSIEWKGHRGAWIAQDSEHRTTDDKPMGHFYILYDDVYAAKEMWMGAVSFRDVFVPNFKEVYSHSLHGFRYSTDPRSKIEAVANRFVTNADQDLKGIGFYTTGFNVSYEVRIRKSLDGPSLHEWIGKEELPGFHYLETHDEKFSWKKGEEVFVEVTLSNHSYAYDASSTIEVLLGSPLPEWGKPIEVQSKASPNESFYLKGKQWKDFSSYVSPYNEQKDHPHSSKNPTANHAITLYAY